jgi:hypothetical protein
MRKRPPAWALIDNLNTDRLTGLFVVLDVIFERLRKRSCDATAAARADRGLVGMILAHVDGELQRIAAIKINSLSKLSFLAL